ncbi:hypothetical protein BAUCODRAFT_510206 [Baudoinia panamericana UAMH 10762]|uniref:Signal recognition particle subunit SRP14 n=1 Tax=Baudoinia panamericana (strain UAMH 10762) TaxID=717646 RepID=M2MH66_BAUPA|nr:uncharacterized protein BAUCODRAFT_510206 [Baudoinia panamericana UAMH 10762]EMC95956.1 hypothetical protein BAUCODRAFT_510206 [Baudoinia panamericana UAMH 10762]
MGASQHLSNEDFFSQLSSLLESTQKKGHGSVYLTQKRCITFNTSSSSPSVTPAKIADDPLWDLHPPNPLPLIVRATDGKSHKLGPEGAKDRTKNAGKTRLSTIVQPEKMEAFFARYAEVCKAGMQSLKKRDRSKRKKDKSKKQKKKGPGAAAAADGKT